MAIYFNETRYGFDYGDAQITRVTSDEKQGWVLMHIGTSKTTIQIKVGRSGIMTFYRDNKRHSLEPVKKAGKR